MEFYDTHRLVKSEDLNHHGTLFAGRMTEWFVESCFITVANEYGHPENLVCLKVHEVKFTKPIKKSVAHTGAIELAVSNRRASLFIDDPSNHCLHIQYFS